MTLRPLVYETVLVLLREQEDLVVRMEAALTLKASILLSYFSIVLLGLVAI